jgi:hypothetical protein
MIEHTVDPARMRWGAWCHERQKEIGKGDIAASYSADRIGEGQPIRKPFDWKGSLWICVGMSNERVEAYRLMHPQAFSGVPTTYRAKTVDGDAARGDPNGFYHGMAVKHGGKDFVLCGPAVTLVAGEPPQMDLFGSLL